MGGFGQGGFGEGPYGGAPLDAVAVAVQNRLEESTDSAGIFWDVAQEIRPAVVEAMNEATLITGEPQVRATTLFTVPASTVFAPLAMPADAVALLRVEGLRKTYVWDLDRQYPGWETAVGDKPRFWFPFGLTMFGIYPCLTGPAQVVLNYVKIPVATPPPYTGIEATPFQAEYIDAFADMAAHIMRFKEAGAEFDQSFAEYNRYLSKMESLSNFAYRKNSLRFTRSAGAQSAINEVRAR